MKALRVALLPALLLVLGAAEPAAAAPVVRQSVGATPADITAAVTTFRSDLGDPNNAAGPPAASGRREINWDGVPDAFAAPNGFPTNFFNSNSPRGVEFATPGAGFLLSMDDDTPADPDPDQVRYEHIHPSYPANFQVFSPQRLFTAISSTITDVSFFVPGTSNAATVSGFGAVFADVELGGSTKLQFFDFEGKDLGTFGAPAGSASNTLSFLGVSFNAGERVGRVRITSGDTPLGAAETAAQDLVVMDDFLYGEPQQLTTYKLDNTSYAGGEGDNLQVTVVRTGGQAGSVNFATSDGAAKAGQDYQATSGTLSFAAGETAKTFSVPLLGDSVSEGNETLTVALSNPVNASLATPAGGTITIVDRGSVQAAGPAPLAGAVRDLTRPGVTISRFPRTLTLEQLLRGFSFVVDPNEPTVFDASLLGAPRSVQFGRSFNLTLARRQLRRFSAAPRRIRLKPSRSLVRRGVRRTRRFSLRVRVIAVDAAGNGRAVTRSIRVRRR